MMEIYSDATSLTRVGCASDGEWRAVGVSDLLREIVTAHGVCSATSDGFFFFFGFLLCSV
jgi:hypothetical protein